MTYINNISFKTHVDQVRIAKKRIATENLMFASRLDRFNEIKQILSTVEEKDFDNIYATLKNDPKFIMNEKLINENKNLIEINKNLKENLQDNSNKKEELHKAKEELTKTKEELTKTKEELNFFKTKMDELYKINTYLNLKMRTLDDELRAEVNARLIQESSDTEVIPVKKRKKTKKKYEAID